MTKSGKEIIREAANRLLDEDFSLAQSDFDSATGEIVEARLIHEKQESGKWLTLTVTLYRGKIQRV